jgi:hypothetical protein
MDCSDDIASLPDDPAVLKSLIGMMLNQRDEAFNRWRQIEEQKRQVDIRIQRAEMLRQEAELKILKLEVELLRLRKRYYGPKADKLASADNHRMIHVGAPVASPQCRILRVHQKSISHTKAAGTFPAKSHNIGLVGTQMGSGQEVGSNFWKFASKF